MIWRKIVWQFDLLIYRLFRWRWNQRFIEDDELRHYFINYLNSWEAIHNEPAMGIGSKPPKMPNPEDYAKGEK